MVQPDNGVQWFEFDSRQGHECIQCLRNNVLCNGHQKFHTEEQGGKNREDSHSPRSSVQI
jgi:hypothetical protein